MEIENKYCPEPGCINPLPKGRKVCNTCRHRKFVEKNRPLMVWHWIKKSAKRRNLEFNLPKSEFINFIIEGGYTLGSGRLKDCLTIDRIDGSRGYTMQNIQIISKSANSAKYHNKEEEYPF